MSAYRESDVKADMPISTRWVIRDGVEPAAGLVMSAVDNHMTHAFTGVAAFAPYNHVTNGGAV
jgi:hypothetical protein